MNQATAKVLSLTAIFITLLITLAVLVKEGAPEPIVLGIAGLIGSCGTQFVNWITGSTKGGGAGGGAAILLVGAATLFGQPGCGAANAPTSQPRDVARAAVVMVSNGLAAADQACATQAAATSDLDMAKQCAAVYSETRAVLLTASDAVDTWDSVATSQETVTCAIVTSAKQLADLSKYLTGKGVPAVNSLDDALTFVAGLNAVCSDTSANISTTVADGGV